MGTRDGARTGNDGVAVLRVGGPTAVLEIGGLRFLTDPTFDPPGDHPVGQRVLTKLRGPAVDADAIEPVDAVLLSHHQHPDNLDRLGRAFLDRVPLVLTTAAAADAIGGPARRLDRWQAIDLERPAGGSLRVTSVPALHGPPGSERLTGEVTGFVVTGDGEPTVYVSGDNASLGVVASIAERFGPVDIAILFAGAARTPLLDAYLTLTSEEAAQAATILGARRIVPLHVEGWAHFTQGEDALRAAFEAAGLSSRLVIAEPGRRVPIDLPA